MCLLRICKSGKYLPKREAVRVGGDKGSAVVSTGVCPRNVLGRDWVAIFDNHKTINMTHLPVWMLRWCWVSVLIWHSRGCELAQQCSRKAVKFQTNTLEKEQHWGDHVNWVSKIKEERALCYGCLNLIFTTTSSSESARFEGAVINSEDDTPRVKDPEMPHEE